MVFVLETGNGTPGANAYTTPTFVDGYLSSRGRSDDNFWSSETLAQKQQRIIVATDYVDRRWGPSFAGSRLTIFRGRSSVGSLAMSTQPNDGEQIVVGVVTYRLVATVTAENDILIGADATETAANIASVITAGYTDGGPTNVLTRPNQEAFAESSGTDVTLTARQLGVSGDDITLSTTITGATVTAFAGGIDQGPQPLEFPRAGLVEPTGSFVRGIPQRLKYSISEYAVRAVAITLDPDPTVDDSGANVQSKREKVGPIEEEVEYVPGARVKIYRPYPQADRWLTPYLVPARGVIRG